MSLNQISVFLENKPGKLQVLTELLAQKHINMRLTPRFRALNMIWKTFIPMADLQTKKKKLNI